MTKHKAISLVSLHDKYLVLTAAPLFKSGKVRVSNKISIRFLKVVLYKNLLKVQSGTFMFFGMNKGRI